MQNGAVQLQVPVEMFRRSTRQMQLCWSNSGQGIKAAGAHKKKLTAHTHCVSMETFTFKAYVARHCLEGSDEDWVTCLRAAV